MTERIITPLSGPSCIPRPRSQLLITRRLVVVVEHVTQDGDAEPATVAVHSMAIDLAACDVADGDARGEVNRLFDQWQARIRKPEPAR